jgi:gliding motility-associated-like protein
MRRNNLKISFLTFVALFFTSIYAQLITTNKVLNTPSRVVFEDEMPSLENYSLVLKKYLKHSVNTTWEPIRTFNDQLGQSHLRLQQYHNGIKVNTGVYIIHSKADKILSINGTYVPELVLKGSKILSSAESIEKMLQSFPSEQYYWQDESMNYFLRDLSDVKDTSYYPVTSLVYCSPNFELGKTHRLCFEANVFSQVPLFGEKVYIDAETGELIASESQILDANVIGKAVTKYSDTQTLNTDSTGVGNYRLRETVHGNGIETYNMRKGTSYGAAVDFTDTDNFWNNANGNQDEVAGDAHWGAATTYDYFFNRFNRNSFDDKGGKIRSYVHYSSNYYNAFWSTACNCMTYGDGNTGNPFPLTCLDVIGHEIAHAVTTNTAGLIYRNESGALNESFSDIFGNTIEAYGKPNGWSWKIGEEISSSGTGFRNMANPNLKGHPKYYKGVSWYFGTGDNGGVHLNSGVQNYWYYLLAQGSSGTNEKGDAFDIDSLGFETAADIAYRNLSVYLTNSSNYSEARTYSIASAVDLFGPCSKEVIMVTNAWWVCGVGAKYDSSQVVANFSADTFACHPSYVFNFRNTSTNSSKNEWNFGDGDTSSARSPQHKYAAHGNYTVKLKAISCFNNKIDSITRISYIKIDSTADICDAVIMARTGLDSVEKCKGFIYDNGGESNYIALVRSDLKVVSPNADSIRLRFHYLDYENNYDSLVLFGKNTSQAEKIGQFTGNTTPNSGNWISIIGDAFWLKHYSDPFVEGAGFKIEFESFHSAFEANLVSDTTLCLGDSLILSPIKTGGSQTNYYHTWNDGSHGNSLIIHPTKDTMVWVETLDICSKEKARDSVMINVRSKLSVSLGEDTTICQGNNVLLNAASSGGLGSAYTYTWTPAIGIASTSLVKPTSSTTYQVILSDGCSKKNDTSSKTIFVKEPLKISMDKDSTLFCIGNGTLLNTKATGGDSLNYTYTWTSSSNTDSFEYITVTDTILVKVTVSDGCTIELASDSVLIYTYPGLNYNKPSDTILCRGTGIDLNVLPSGGLGSGYNVIWDHGKSGIISEIPTKKETYSFTLSDGCSPQVKDSIIVDLFDPINIIDLKDTTLCDGQILTLGASATGGRPSSLVVRWLPGNLFGNSQNFNLPHGSKITAIAEDGCTIASDTTSLTLSRLSPLQANISANPSAICVNQESELTLTQSGGLTAQRLQYLNGVLEPNIKINLSLIGNTKYVLKVDDGCSTPAMDSLEITVNALPTATLGLSQKDICEDQQVTFNYTSTQTLTDLWWKLTPLDSFKSTSSNQVINAPKPDKYLVKASFIDANGCSSTAVMPDTLTVYAKPKASFTADPRISHIENNRINFTNTSTGSLNWIWFFGDGQSEINNDFPSHIYEDTGTYSATLISSSLLGCNDTASLSIRINDIYRIWLPNTFSPNDNGVNDQLLIRGQGIKSLEMKIYDRWGSLIFKTNNMNEAWNGKNKDGKEYPNGQYILVLKVHDVLGEFHHEKGVIQIIR